MKYRLEIEGGAAKGLQKLPRAEQRRIIKKLKFYLAQEDPLDYAAKLVGKPSGEYRWRIGPYRAIFDVDGDSIKLLQVQHRRDIYR